VFSITYQKKGRSAGLNVFPSLASLVPKLCILSFARIDESRAFAELGEDGIALSGHGRAGVNVGGSTYRK
jgi:hypothetical protein